MVAVEKVKANYILDKLNEDIEIDFENEKEFIEYMNMLHGNDDGAISILKKFSKTKTQRWSVDIKDKLQICKLFKEENLYCSVNSFYAKGKHEGKYVKKLNALIVDLDYYNVEHLKYLSEDQVMYLLEQDLNYPPPSYYIGSGKGIYLIWLLNETYATPSSKKYWRKLEDTLIDLFKDFGADVKVKDEARVLRKVGSINASNDKKVKVLQTNRAEDGSVLRYEMGYIADYFWGFREYSSKPKTKKIKKKKQKNKVYQIRNIHTLYFSRYKDLETLVDLRSNSQATGYREKLLFLYRLNLLYFGKEEDVALDMTLELNNKLCIPLDEYEVINSTKNAEGVARAYHRLVKNYKEEYGLSIKSHLQNSGVYMYTNKTIIKDLIITEEEQRQMLTLIGDVVKKERKDIRNEIYYEENKEVINKNKKNKYHKKLKKENKLTRDEQVEKREDKIRKLLEQKLSQRNIADELGISIGAVNKYVKKIKENKIRKDI